jgi:hypothetical protein
VLDESFTGGDHAGGDVTAPSGAECSAAERVVVQIAYADGGANGRHPGICAVVPTGRNNTA